MQASRPGPSLTLTSAADGTSLSFTPRAIVLAGYTGRDQAAVQRHVNELLAQGIPAPRETPELYRIPASKLQVDGTLPRGQGWSSGEVEYVLLLTESGTFVGVGSDHTDRDLERTSMIEAKQAFSKIVGREVWPLQDLLRDWDNLRLRSWVTDSRGRRPYQDGPIADIMEPTSLLALVTDDERRAGLVLYSGTVPVLDPERATGACRFEGQITDRGGRALARCDYTYEA